MMRRFSRLLVCLGLTTALWGTLAANDAAEAAPTAAPVAAPAVASAETSDGVARVSTVAYRSKIDRRCKVRGRVLCIDKTRDKLYYLRNGKVIKTMDARFGCARTRTREGRFRVFRKNRYVVSSLYHTPMPLSMFFSGGQAVHYSADFAARGYNGCSHGCVNIRNKAKLRYVFNRIRIGDRVVVYRS